MDTVLQDEQIAEKHALAHFERTLHLDADHTALRVVVGLVFLATIPIAYILINIVWTAESGINFIGIFGGLIIAYGAAWALERTLRNRWKSGRVLHITPAQVAIKKNDQIESAVDATQQVNVLMWRFTVKKRARVPKGWYMIACALEQDDTYIAMYTFISPDEFKALPESGQYTALISKKESKDKDGKDMRLAGEQRRLHTAEHARWMHGGELAREDFDTYIADLQAHFPRWMPALN